MESLSRVPGDDELFVGGILTLRRRSALGSEGITHIVSVLKYDFKDFEEWEKYAHLSIEVDDMEDENLLGEFERSGKWIEDALKEGGKVLIHCAMGRSRSVTITIAFMLRKYPHLTVLEALNLIRKSRPMAEPNSGFMTQLDLYKEMGCPRDLDAQQKYQRWLYSREVELALAARMAPRKVRFEDEEVQDIREGAPGVERELRCKRCRRTLATTPYLVSHVPGSTSSIPIYPSSTSSTATAGQPQQPTNTPSPCTHHFLHPLSWMRPELEKGLLANRLECPNSKCLAQVGRYAWQGMRCSCGVWVLPAISLQKGRVDEVIKRGESDQISGEEPKSEAEKMRGMGIRLPPGMKGKENL